MSLSEEESDRLLRAAAVAWVCWEADSQAGSPTANNAMHLYNHLRERVQAHVAEVNGWHQEELTVEQLAVVRERIYASAIRYLVARENARHNLAVPSPAARWWECFVAARDEYWSATH